MWVCGTKYNDPYNHNLISWFSGAQCSVLYAVYFICGVFFVLYYKYTIQIYCENPPNKMSRFSSIIFDLPTGSYLLSQSAICCCGRFGLLFCAVTLLVWIMEIWHSTENPKRPVTNDMIVVYIYTSRPTILFLAIIDTLMTVLRKFAEKTWAGSICSVAY